jgi:uncharacterized protein (DUF1800 family)
VAPGVGCAGPRLAGAAARSSAMMAPRGKTAFARRVRLAASAVAIAAFGYGAVPQPEAHAEDVVDVYSWDLELSPVCLDGIFDVAMKVGQTTKRPELHASTDVRGHVKGLLVFDGQGLTLSGTVERAVGAVHVDIKAKSYGNKITFTGDVADGGKTLTGTWTGKGPLAAGTGTFTSDLSGAGPLVATVECALTQDAKGRLKGTAHVASCGQDVALTVSGKWDAGAVKLALKQKSFRFVGLGVGTGTDADLDWTVKGFGASGEGAGLHLSRIEAPAELVYPPIASEYETELPIPTIIPTSGDSDRDTFRVLPSLPDGIVLDPDNGRITGTPTAVIPGRSYTITASNYAGSSSATIAFGTRIQRARSFAPETRFLTDADYKHFLGRAEFGVRQLGGGQTTLTRVNQIGLDAYIDSMLVFATNGPAESIAAPELGNSNFPSSTQLSSWWSSLMMNSTNPFQERLAFFWADRFAVSAQSLEVGEAHFMREYINLFRYEGNGNLRSLLLKMARSGAMLKYLNGNVNTLDYPNENFAREFWELFTLGVDNVYTQPDIVQASRAWTGWKFVTNPSTGLVTPVFDPLLHDPGPKTVLGQVVAAQNATDDYQTMVDLTIDNAPVAEFIAKRLFEHFGFDNPHPTLVADMAANLRQNNYALAPFLKALFKSEAFFSSTARGALVKSPMDFSVGFIHATGLKITPTSFQTLLSTLGQPPAVPPSVNGFPQGELWFSAQNMADRVNLLDACVNDTSRQTSAGINVANILPPPGQRSAAQVVDAMSSLFNLTLVTGERQKLIDFMNSAGVFDGTTQTQIDDKVRGLLEILAQHPSYQLR